MAADAVADRGSPWTLLETKTSPPVLVTVAQEAVIPGRVGIRKDWAFSLLKFTAKADLVLRTQEVVYGFSVKDRLIGGRFSANIPARMLEYRKKLRFPNGACLAVSAGAQYIGSSSSSRLQDQIKPYFGLQMELGDVGAGNAVWSGDGFDVKQRIPTPLLNYPKLEVEVFGSIKVPMLTARYSVQQGLPSSAPSRQNSSLGVSSDNKPLHLHLAQTNLVFRL